MESSEICDKATSWFLLENCLFFFSVIRLSKLTQIIYYSNKECVALRSVKRSSTCGRVSKHLLVLLISLGGLVANSCTEVFRIRGVSNPRIDIYCYINIVNPFECSERVKGVPRQKMSWIQCSYVENSRIYFSGRVQKYYFAFR